MGSEGELGVARDTGILRKERAEDPVVDGGAPQAGDGSHGRLAMGMLFVSLLACGCGSDQPAPGPAAPAGPSAEAERAGQIVAGLAPLPARPEAVALADVVSIAAHKEGRTPEGARLSRLAADLRARLWRFDQTATDAREAGELYAAAALAAGGTEEGCEAERRRALLAGELARDAAVSYREIYLASRRHQSRVAPGTAPGRCAAGLEMALASAIAYRPALDAMAALEREGDAAAQKGAPPPAAIGTASTLIPAPAPGDAASGAVPAPGPTPGGDVVVSPKEDAVGKDPVKLVAIEPFGGEDAARVVLRLAAPVTFQVGTLGVEGGSSAKNPRVFVDIARATSKGMAHEMEVGGLVRRVRIGAREGGTRVVLDLASTAIRRVFYLPDPFRIVIDVTTRARVVEDKPTPSGTREIRRVALDPGHGGTDSGAVGPTGLREKDVTLDIAHRAAPLLAHELQIETLLTRDNDTYVPLDLRAARANNYHADLFVSIHCNASENGAARGVQTFVLDEARDPDGLAARVAARENAQRGRDGGEALSAAVLSNLNVAAMSARSRHVAELLQRSALGSLATRYPDTRDQGIKTAGFFVLVGADMPAVLFETAFISNADDEGRLATADYRQKFADAIVNAVRAYRAGK
jgi:N-acetylmuramoyl-L-alanine amidase